jgi:ABC-type transporter Mla subunit MlaD
MSELIARLLDEETDLADCAADRIKELEERNKELAQFVFDAGGQAADTLDKLAKAVEALRKLVRLDDDYSPFGGELLRDRVVRTWEEARAVLAELEKQ